VLSTDAAMDERTALEASAAAAATPEEEPAAKAS